MPLRQARARAAATGINQHGESTESLGAGLIPPRAVTAQEFDRLHDEFVAPGPLRIVEPFTIRPDTPELTTGSVRTSRGMHRQMPSPSSDEDSLASASPPSADSSGDEYVLSRGNTARGNTAETWVRNSNARSALTREMFREATPEAAPPARRFSDDTLGLIEDTFQLMSNSPANSVATNASSTEGSPRTTDQIVPDFMQQRRAQGTANRRHPSRGFSHPRSGSPAGAGAGTPGRHPRSPAGAVTHRGFVSPKRRGTLSSMHVFHISLE